MATLPKRSDIQGLRAIAILLVVLAHSNVSLFSGGFIGVDIFFVLSGYLITRILIREYELNQTIQLMSFFTRRLKRLLPALLTMLVLVALISPFLITSYEFRQQLSSLAYATTWTSNLFFTFSTTNYFSELQTRDLFLHTWSLGVEEQFYLVWAPLLLFILSILSKLVSPKNQNAMLSIVLNFVFFSSFSLCLYWSITQPLWAFYLVPSRIWQFALGAGIYVWLERKYMHDTSSANPNLPANWAAWSGVCGLTLIVSSATLIHPDMTYPSFWALIPSMGAALIIVAGIKAPSQKASQLLSHPILVWFGDRSYSWYLWHWPLLMLGFSEDVHLTEKVVLVLISLLLAMISYRWIELPFWKGKWSYSVPTRSILLSSLAMVLVFAGMPKYLASISRNENELAVKVANTARADSPIIYSLGCDDWYNNAEVRPCKIGNNDASKTIVLLGDSIGAQWFSMIPEIFQSPNWRIEVLTKSSCPMVDEDFFYQRIGKNYDICTEWRNSALDYLSSSNPDIIIVGSAATYNFSEKQWIKGSERIFSRLAKAATQVLVLPGTPKLSFNGPACLERWYKAAARKNITPDRHVCQEVLASKQAVEVALYLDQAAQNFANVQLLNLNDLVCPESYCTAENATGLVVFRDQQHLTNSFVLAQVQHIINKLKKIELAPLRQ